MRKAEDTSSTVENPQCLWSSICICLFPVFTLREWVLTTLTIIFYNSFLMPKVLGSRETTPQLHKSICEQAAQGQPLSQIATYFHLPLHTVQSIVKRGAERGYNENEPQIGRPQKIDGQALRHLKLNILRDRRQSLQNITANANLFLPSPVDTLQHRLYTYSDWSGEPENRSRGDRVERTPTTERVGGIPLPNQI